MPRIRLNLTLSPAAAAALDRLAREIAEAEGRDPERCRSAAMDRVLIELCSKQPDHTADLRKARDMAEEMRVYALNRMFGKVQPGDFSLVNDRARVITQALDRVLGAQPATGVGETKVSK